MDNQKPPDRGKPKRSRDTFQAAYQIVKTAIGEREEEYESAKDPAAQHLGSKGGKARTHKLSIVKVLENNTYTELGPP